MNDSSLRQRLFQSAGAKSPQGRKPLVVDSENILESDFRVGAGCTKIAPSSQQQSDGSHWLQRKLVTQDDLGDSLQRARQNDSQRSRLIIGSRFASPKVEGRAGQGPSGIRPASAMSVGPHRSHALALPHGMSSNTRSTFSGSPSAPLKDVVDIPQFHAFSERKPAKSLRQRLGSGTHSLQVHCRTILMLLVDDFHEPSVRDPGALSGDLGEFYLAAQRDQLAPHAHSRSASFLSSVPGRPQDDISSIMMRGATDLRNAKFEVEELVRLYCNIMRICRP